MREHWRLDGVVATKQTQVLRLRCRGRGCQSDDEQRGRQHHATHGDSLRTRPKRRSARPEIVSACALRWAIRLLTRKSGRGERLLVSTHAGQSDRRVRRVTGARRTGLGFAIDVPTRAFNSTARRYCSRSGSKPNARITSARLLLSA